MKKKRNCRSRTTMRMSGKIFLIMKLTFSLLFLCVVQLSASVYSQNAKLSLDMKNRTVKEVLQSIEEQSEFRFFYNEQFVDLNRKVSVSIENENVESILGKIFGGANISFKVMENNLIIITPAERIQTQQKTITGKVTDSSGQPLPGVSVIIKGTTNGMITNVDGTYSLVDVPSNSILLFSFVGMKSQEIIVAGNNQINVLMEEETIGLEEVVAIGYGSDSKRNISGSISSAKSSDIKDQSVVSFDQALAGRLAGVDIQQSNGAPGGGVTMNIRGVNSITGGNQPLFVVDGVPITGGLDNFSQGNDPQSGTASLNPLNSLNPNDIESIEILKDAASAAIYGSRASKGVVIIKTKGGSLNQKMDINFHSSLSYAQVAHKVDVMNAYEFANYMKLARDLSWVAKDPIKHSASDPYSVRGYDDVVPSYMTPYLEGKPGLLDTDWQDAIYRTAASKNVGMSFSGGTEKTKYFISFDYLKQEGVIINSGLERITAKINMETQLSKNARLGINLTPSKIHNDLVVSEKNWGKEAVVIAALMSHPEMPVYNDDGSLRLDQAFNVMWSGESNIVQVQNPVALATMITNTMDEYRLMGNTFFEVDFLKDFTFKTMIGIDYNEVTREYYRPKNLSYRTEPAPTAFYNMATERRSLIFNSLFENTLNYDKVIGNHSIKALLGFSAQQEENDYTEATGRDFTSDAAHTIGNGLTRDADSDKREWSMLSYFSRGIYNYLGRYMVTVSMRADGSSRFGIDSKWGYFPSVSGAWRVSDEDFFKKLTTKVNDLKLRASYGWTGNNDISYYGSQALMSVGKYVIGDVLKTGLYPSSSPNSNLSWETTKTLNVGFDISILKDRLSFTGDYYNSNTEDLLLDVPVPASSGYTTSLQNIGKVQNSGLEFVINYSQTWGDFTWNSSLNFTANRNKVIKLGPNQDQIISSGGLTASHVTRIGHPIGSFFGHKVLGKFETADQLVTIPTLVGGNQAIGDFIYEDYTKDGKVNDDDRQILGNNYPDYVIGFTNNFGYKNFDLSINIITKQGMDALNTMHRYTAEAWGNNLSCYLDDDAPRPVWGVGSKSHTRPSSWHVEDASFIRIRNIAFGYTLPKSLSEKAKLKQVRVYVSAMNPFTWTKYSGYNPEVSSNYGNALTPGEEFGNYPSEKSFMMGLNVNF